MGHACNLSMKNMPIASSACADALTVPMLPTNPRHAHPNIKPRVDIGGNGTLDVSSRIIEQVLAWFASRRNLASGEMLDKNGTSPGCR
jgi:hypothetical protein